MRTRRSRHRSSRAPRAGRVRPPRGSRERAPRGLSASRASAITSALRSRKPSRARSPLTSCTVAPAATRRRREGAGDGASGRSRGARHAATSSIPAERRGAARRTCAVRRAGPTVCRDRCERPCGCGRDAARLRIGLTERAGPLRIVRHSSRVTNVTSAAVGRRCRRRPGTLRCRGTRRPEPA